MVKQSLILIPPSEGKNSGGGAKPLRKVSPDIKEMMDRLHNYSGQPEQLFGVKGKALSEAIETNKNILNTPTMPAIERYAGVVYDGIGYELLNPAAKEFLQEHVRIVSAMFGLIEPLDLIPDYKLKIEKLDAQKHWRPIIAQDLRNFFVIDLLPLAHRKAVEYEQGISVDFVYIRKEKRIPAGHDGKFIKGRFVRWLCENQVTDPKAFADFKEDNFKWNGFEFVKKVS